MYLWTVCCWFIVTGSSVLICACCQATFSRPPGSGWTPVRYDSWRRSRELWKSVMANFQYSKGYLIKEVTEKKVIVDQEKETRRWWEGIRVQLMCCTSLCSLVSPLQSQEKNNDASSGDRAEQVLFSELLPQGENVPFIPSLSSRMCTPLNSSNSRMRMSFCCLQACSYFSLMYIPFRQISHHTCADKWKWHLNVIRVQLYIDLIDCILNKKRTKTDWIIWHFMTAALCT